MFSVPILPYKLGGFIKVAKSLNTTLSHFYILKRLAKIIMKNKGILDNLKNNHSVIQEVCAEIQ